MSKRGYLAVDIGGTKLSVGVVSLTGEVLSHGRVLTPQINVWQELQELIKSQVAESSVDLIACGVGC
ncbi:MAG: ROK family protein, partial [Actinomycetota bacterium]|nr:ROK family protein [Actinomycetota bacterium]